MRSDIMRKLLGQVLIFMVLITLITGVVYAANSYSKQLTVQYGVVKKMVIDGIDKTPTDPKNQPFVYEGTTYVPLRYVSESLGKEVSWEGTTGTVFIGKNPAEADYLTDKKIYAQECAEYRIDNSLQSNKNFDNNFPSDYIMTMASKQYAKGIAIDMGLHDEGYIIYNLNGEYSRLRGLFGFDDRYLDGIIETNIAFYVDNKLVNSYTFKKGDLPKAIDVALNYGMQLKIVFTAESVPFGDRYFNLVNMILEK
jgi:hypothetical protein